MLFRSNCSGNGVARTIVQSVGIKKLPKNCLQKLRLRYYFNCARYYSNVFTLCSLLLIVLIQQSLPADEILPADAPQSRTVAQQVIQADNHVDVRKMPERMKKQKVKVVKQGSSKATARKAAIAAIPYDTLNDRETQIVKQIIQNSGMFRTLQTLEFECEPQVYQFFTANPDVACSIWRNMEISKLEMLQTGRDEYEIDLKEGTVGEIELFKRGNKSNLIVCNGKFKSPLLVKPIKAIAVIHVQADYATNKAGKRVVQHTANLFVSFPSQTVETAAKLISPVSNIMIDRNFREITLFAYMMSKAMKQQPGWVEQRAKQLEGVLEIRKKQLIKVTANVYLEHRREQLQQQGKTDISLDDILQPLRQASAVEK